MEKTGNVGEMQRPRSYLVFVGMEPMPSNLDASIPSGFRLDFSWRITLLISKVIKPPSPFVTAAAGCKCAWFHVAMPDTSTG